MRGIFRLRQRRVVENVDTAPRVDYIAVNEVHVFGGQLSPRCPCRCGCHRRHEAPALCNEEMVGTEAADQKIAAGGENVCWWCYTVCEGA